MFKQYAGTRFVVWIRIAADPHAKLRGYSILNKEFRVEGYEPVRDEMRDLRGQTMMGNFWPVKAEEVYRVVPKLQQFDDNGKAWFFPIEFCESFVRPYDYLSYQVKELILPWKASGEDDGDLL